MGSDSDGVRACEAFLAGLYGEAEEGYLCLSTPAADGGLECLWFPIAERARIAAEAVRLAAARDVYFGIGLHPIPRGPRSRGEARGVWQVPGAWIEVDVRHPCHKAANLPADREEALGLLARFPLAPGWVVASGHGLHAWWPFHEPWVLESEAENAQAARLVRRLQRWFQREARECGWRIDSTHDLARVLRLPGTWNRKDPADLRPVETLHGDASRRYHPSDFDELLPEVEEFGVRWEPREGQTLVPLAPLVAGCAFLRHARDDAKVLPEPDWYAALTILGRCQDGARHAHAWSKPYPRYDREETEKKLAQATSATGPRSCAGIRYDLDGERFCAACPHWGRIKSPIVLGMEGGERTPMPGDADAPPGPRDTAEAVHAADRRANAATQQLAALDVRAVEAGRNGKNGRHAPEPFSFAKGLTAATLQGIAFPDLVWPVPGLICEGLTLTSGREKMGKSRLFEEMAVAIATGGRVFGVDEFRAVQGDVLLLALEEEERLIQERLRQWLGDVPWPDNLTIFTEWPKQGSERDAIHFLDAWMEYRPGTNFILLDTFRRVRGPSRQGENAYEADSKALQPFHDFTRRHLGLAMTIVHHSNKLNAEDDHDTISGSTGLAAVPDRIMVLRRKRGEPVATLSYSGRRGPYRKIRLRDDSLTGTWVYEGEADEKAAPTPSPERFAVIQALTGRWLTATDLAHELDRTEDKEYNALRRLLTKLKEAGVLVNGGGKWTVYGTATVEERGGV